MAAPVATLDVTPLKDAILTVTALVYETGLLINKQFSINIFPTIKMAGCCNSRHVVFSLYFPYDVCIQISPSLPPVGTDEE